MDRGEVALLGPGHRVGVAEFLDLTLAQPADRASQQSGDLGAERCSDLGRPRQQEVAGEDRLQIAPPGVDRVDAASGLGLVHHIVVVQRPEVHQFTRDTTLHDIVGGGATGQLAGHDRQHRSQSFPSGDDQVRRDLGEVGVGGDDRGPHGGLDPRTIGLHAGHGEQGRRHRGVGHDWQARRCGVAEKHLQHVLC